MPVPRKRRTSIRKPTKSRRVPQARHKKKNPKLPSITRIIAGDLFGKTARLKKRSAAPKSAKKSKSIEREARRQVMVFRGGIKQAEEIIRLEKKFRHAQPIHRRILRKAQSTAGKLAMLKEYGLYNPKRKPSEARVEKAWRENRDFLEPGYLFVKRPKSDKAYAEVKKRAKHSDIKATEKGLFYKTDYRSHSAKLVKNRATGYAISTKREYHDAHNRLHKETVLTPLATADELSERKEALREEFNKKARKTKGKRNTYVRYYIEGKFGSHSEFTSDEFDKMWQELEREHSGKGTVRTDADLYGFVNRIKIGISTPTSRRNKVMTRNELEYKKKLRKKKASKSSRYSRGKGRA